MPLSPSPPLCLSLPVCIARLRVVSSSLQVFVFACSCVACAFCVFAFTVGVCFFFRLVTQALSHLRFSVCMLLSVTIAKLSSVILHNFPPPYLTPATEKKHILKHALLSFSVLYCFRPFFVFGLDAPACHCTSNQRVTYWPFISSVVPICVIVSLFPEWRFYFHVTPFHCNYITLIFHHPSHLQVVVVGLFKSRAQKSSDSSVQRQILSLVLKVHRLNSHCGVMTQLCILSRRSVVGGQLGDS